MNHIVKILMDRDEITQEEAQAMVDECRQHLEDEAVSAGDIELAEEIIAEELGLEPDYMMDLLFLTSKIIATPSSSLKAIRR